VLVRVTPLSFTHPYFFEGSKRRAERTKRARWGERGKQTLTPNLTIKGKNKGKSHGFLRNGFLGSDFIASRDRENGGSK